YDPRRIVREALADGVLPPSRPVRPARTTGTRPGSAVRSPRTPPPNQAARRRSRTAGKKTDDGAHASVTTPGAAPVTQAKPGRRARGDERHEALRRVGGRCRSGGGDQRQA